MERPAQSACKHFAPEGPRDFRHVRDFTNHPLFNGDRRRNQIARKPLLNRPIRWRQ